MAEIVGKVADRFQALRERHLNGLKPPGEFFDYRQMSRPRDLNDATARLTYNSRAFSGWYILIIAALAIWALLTNPFLLLAIGLFAGGFVAINKFGPDPITVGNQVITQKTLYIALFVIGVPLMILANPFSVFFWLIGSSAVLILVHAVLMEPGLENEYSSVEQV